MTLFQFFYCAFGVYFSGGESATLPTLIAVWLWVQMLLPLIISLALLAMKSRTAHYLGLAALIVIMVLHYGSAVID
jgi:hypothetical protein